MTLLVASLAALLVGPLLVRLAASGRPLLAFLDGFVIVSITGLVFLEVLPHSLHEGGLWAAGAALAGLVLPRSLEHLLEGRRATERSRGLLLFSALAGLAVHALLDGAALAPTVHHHAHAHSPGAADHGLGLSVIFHRIPFGLVVWWTVRPRHGLGPALGILGLIAAATVAGFALGGAGVEHLPLTALVSFQALVAGALLHIIFEHPVQLAGAEPTGLRYAEGAGAVGAMALLAWLLHSHGGDERAPAAVVLALALRIAPALLAGFVLTGLALTFLPRGKSSLTEAARGALVGVRGMAKTGAGLPSPGAPGRAFIAAASILGLDALLVSSVLLGSTSTGLRAATGAAAVLGLILVALAASRTHAAPPPPAPAPASPHRRGPLAALGTSLGPVVDRTLAWVVFGLFGAALIDAALPGDWLRTVSPGLALFSITALGLTSYLCALGSTPLVLALLAKGLSPAAALALVIVAPAGHPDALARLPGRGARIAYRAAAAALALAAGGALLALAPNAPAVALPQAPVTPTNWVALGLLCLVGAAALLRRGPRGLLRELTPGGGLHHHHPHLGGPHAPAAALGNLGHTHHHDH